MDDGIDEAAGRIEVHCSYSTWADGWNALLGDNQRGVMEWRGPAEVRLDPIIKDPRSGGSMLTVYADPDNRSIDVFGREQRGVDVGEIVGEDRDRFLAELGVPYRTTIHMTRMDLRQHARLGGAEPSGEAGAEQIRFVLESAQEEGVALDPADEAAARAALADPGAWTYGDIERLVLRLEVAMKWRNTTEYPQQWNQLFPLGAEFQGRVQVGRGRIWNPEAPWPVKKYYGPPREEAWIYDVGERAGGYIVTGSHTWKWVGLTPEQEAERREQKRLEEWRQTRRGRLVEHLRKLRGKFGV